MKCRKCAHEEFTFKQITFRDGTINHEARCKMCKAFLKYVAQDNKDPDDFVMPYGTFKGFTLSQINGIDPKYLQWAARGLDDRTAKRRIRKFLEDIKALSA